MVILGSLLSLGIFKLLRFVGVLVFFVFFLFLFFWPHHTACSILAPWTGIGPTPLEAKAQESQPLDHQAIPTKAF